MKVQSKMASLFQNGLITVSAVAMGVSAVYLFAPPDYQVSVDPLTTAVVADSELRGTEKAMVSMPESPEQASLKEALKALDSGDIDAVRAAIKMLPKTSVEHQLLKWLVATSGKRDVTVAEIRDAQRQLTDWPSQNVMTQNLERAMARSGFSAIRLRLTLGDKPPQTFQAAYAIAQTYIVSGDKDKVRALLIPYWHDQVLSAADEKSVLQNFGDALTKRDHEIRFFNMMARERVKSGERLAEVIDGQNLLAAWTAVIRRQKSAVKLMDSLTDADRKTMAYAFMQVEHLRRTDDDEAALAILQALPIDAEALINPSAWWDERRIISRHFFEAGNVEKAYQAVAPQTGGDDETQVDAAFHAGWYALRGLNDPVRAVPHFEKIINVAKGNISKSRGYYWLGRALADKDKSKQAYEKAAEFDTTFYGQLASAALGRPLASGGIPVSRVDGKNNAPLKAASLLNSIGETGLSRKLYLSLGWSLTNPSQIRDAADQASADGDYYAALKIGKAADWRGIDVGSLTHPTGAISDGTNLSGSDHALAYAVARQESEFNVAAVSSANAKGILQILPATAKDMARRQNIAYLPQKLTTDANYNARLGTAYLNRQLDRFDGSYILTFAAYNAGPSRADEWIERFGDPRGKPLDEVIDWIEKIPFPETRSYVQRILENLQVYKLKLGEEADLVHDLRYGKSD